LAFRAQCPSREAHRLARSCSRYHGAKARREELRASEERSRALFDSNLLGVCYGNARSGAITEANDKLLEMIGYDHEDLRAGRVNWLR